MPPFGSFAPQVADAAAGSGLPPYLSTYLPRIVQIESGGDPGNRTGSYSGLLQMGPAERAKYGGDSLSSGLKLMTDNYNEFKSKFGRDPTPTEFYLTHQQGLGGLSAHLANPDAPAWQNMANTAEGKQKGAGWAKQAILGNIPSDMRSQFPDPQNITSQQFMDVWKHKVERPGGGTDLPPATAQGAPAPQGTGAAPQGILSGTPPAATQNNEDIGPAIQKALAFYQSMTKKPDGPPLQPINFPVPPGLRRQA